MVPEGGPLANVDHLPLELLCRSDQVFSNAYPSIRSTSLKYSILPPLQDAPVTDPAPRHPSSSSTTVVVVVASPRSTSRRGSLLPDPTPTNAPMTLVYEIYIMWARKMGNRMRGLLQQEEEEVTPTVCHMLKLTIGNDSSRYDSFIAASWNSSSVSTEDDEEDSSSSSAKSTSPSPREYSAMTTDDDDDEYACCSAAASSTSTRTLDRRWNIMVFVIRSG